MYMFTSFLPFLVAFVPNMAIAMPIPKEVKNQVLYLISRPDAETEAEALEVLSVEEVSRREDLLLQSLHCDEYDETGVLKALVSLYMDAQNLEEAKKWCLRLVAKVAAERFETNDDVISQYALLEYASRPSIETANNLIDWVNRDIFPSSTSLSVAWSIFFFVLTDKHLDPEAKKLFIDNQEIWYIRGLQKEQLAYDIDGPWHTLDKDLITLGQYRNLSEHQPFRRWSPVVGYNWPTDFRLLSRAFYF